MEGETTDIVGPAADISVVVNGGRVSCVASANERIRSVVFQAQVEVERIHKEILQFSHGPALDHIRVQIFDAVEFD